MFVCRGATLVTPMSPPLRVDFVHVFSAVTCRAATLPPVGPSRVNGGDSTCVPRHRCPPPVGPSRVNGGGRTTAQRHTHTHTTRYTTTPSTITHMTTRRGSELRFCRSISFSLRRLISLKLNYSGNGANIVLEYSK